MRALHIHHTDIINSQGTKVYLRGINLGCWLIMEGYLLGGRNIPEQVFKQTLRKIFGKKNEDKFTALFRKYFITRSDFATIRSLGFNCVRIPFNYRLLTENNSEGFAFLDKALWWCEEYDLYAILDMHAVPGAQNADWHSDSLGTALFWEHEKYRNQALRLWKTIARRYKDVSAIAGYDIMNEPVTDKTKLLNAFYRSAIETIRSAGDNHIIFMEPNQWAQEIEMLAQDIMKQNNVAVSIHFYHPLDHAFNFMPGQNYPGIINKEKWDAAKIARCLKRYATFQQRVRVPIYVGEFGINTRCYHCHHELRLIRDTVSLFNRYQWHWTYWTYKGVAGGLFPNGVYQLLTNHPWINRQGLIQGWETYSALPFRKVLKIPRQLRTIHFVKHKPLAKLLSKRGRGTVLP